MRRRRSTEEQNIGFIKLADAGVDVADLCSTEDFSTKKPCRWPLGSSAGPTGKEASCGQGGASHLVQ